jgi:hypothetical protein
MYRMLHDEFPLVQVPLAWDNATNLDVFQVGRQFANVRPYAAMGGSP